MRLSVYFIHAAGLKDRERIIGDFQKLIQKHFFKNIKKTKVQVITEYDPHEIQGDLIQRTVSYAQIKEPENLLFYNQFLKNMHLFQLSNSLKHYKALEYIANSEDDEISIVFEDDIIYDDKICELFEKLLDALPEERDMIFLGLPAPEAPKDRSEIKLQALPTNMRVLPYTDSYMITKTAAKKLYDEYLPIKFSGNVHLSYLIEKVGFKPQMCIPNITVDGSKYGMFLSTLNPNNALMFNSDYMRLRAAVHQPDLIDMDELIAKSIVQNHPDFMHLKALYLQKQKKYKEAEEVFETALKVYASNSCIVNHESVFLKDYIRLYKNMQ